MRIRNSSATLQALTDGCVCVKDEGGEWATPADLTVPAMGVRSERSLRGELESAFDSVILVGDAEHLARSVRRCTPLWTRRSCNKGKNRCGPRSLNA